MIAVSSTTGITISVIGFFALMALLTFLRILLRREPPGWSKFRVGLFVERVAKDTEPEYRPPLPPTTYQPPPKEEKEPE